MTTLIIYQELRSWTKTALNLLTEYGTLEKVIENVEQLKGRLQEQVRADQEIA